MQANTITAVAAAAYDVFMRRLMWPAEKLESVQKPKSQKKRILIFAYDQKYSTFIKLADRREHQNAAANQRHELNASERARRRNFRSAARLFRAPPLAHDNDDERERRV